jgi:hypothetical protein
MLLLIILLILLFAGGGGYYGYRRWGYGGGADAGLGTIVLVVLLVYFLGGVRFKWFSVTRRDRLLQSRFPSFA